MGQNYIGSVISGLSLLYTEEGRAAAVSALVFHRARIPEAALNPSIDFYVTGGHPEKGARLARQAGLETAAKNIYGLSILDKESRGNYLEAADLAKEAGMPELEKKLLERAIKADEGNGNLYRAARTAESRGRYETGRRLREQAKKEFENRKPTGKYGTVNGNKGITRKSKAFPMRTSGEIAILQEEGEIELAAQAAIEKGMPGKAIQIYADAGWTEQAIGIAIRERMPEEALRICEKAADFVLAERIARDTGFAKLAEVYSGLKSLSNSRKSKI